MYVGLWDFSIETELNFSTSPNAILTHKGIRAGFVSSLKRLLKRKTMYLHFTMPLHDSKKAKVLCCQISH